MFGLNISFRRRYLRQLEICIEFEIIDLVRGGEGEGGGGGGVEGDEGRITTPFLPPTEVVVTSPPLQ